MCSSSSIAPYGFQTLAFPASFTNLVSVSWDHVNPAAFVAYDNIITGETPVGAEPTTWSRVKALYTDR